MRNITTTDIRRTSLADVWLMYAASLDVYDALQERPSTEEREQQLDRVAEIVALHAEELRQRDLFIERIREVAPVRFG